MVGISLYLSALKMRPKPCRDAPNQPVLLERCPMARTLLIVSDSAPLSRMLGITLKGGGYDAVDCREAGEALIWLGKGKAHVILVDMDMLAMDGVTFVEEVRRLPCCRFTPVIMLTMGADDATRRRALNAGVKHWIAKPFQPPILLEMVYRLILV